MANIGDTAIVLGRSMAGLAAAAALVRHFDHAIIVEKDAAAEEPEPRPGVGQGHHLHNLLQGGQRSIQKLLPGMGMKLLGAVLSPSDSGSTCGLTTTAFGCLGAISATIIWPRLARSSSTRFPKECARTQASGFARTRGWMNSRSTLADE